MAPISSTDNRPNEVGYQLEVLSYCLTDFSIRSRLRYGDHTETQFLSLLGLVQFGWGMG